MLMKTLLRPTEKCNLRGDIAPASGPERRALAWLEDRLEHGRKSRCTEVVGLTPEMASLVLARCNQGNRHVVEGTVRRYAETMRRGEWLLTDHGISFSREGVLNDGQHRLAAIVQAGQPIQVTVTFGCAREEFSVIDQGRSRRGSDLLSIAGYKNSATAAALAHLLYRVEQRLSAAPDPKQVMEYAMGLPRARFDLACASGQAAYKRTTPTAAAAAYYLVDRDSAFAARLPAFWDQFVSGEMLPKGSPILALHAHLGSEKDISRHGGRQQNVQRAAAIIIAWNAWATRSRRASLLWPHAVTLPEVR